MSIDVEFLKQVYQRFNARDIEAVLAALHSDVTWANGMVAAFVTWSVNPAVAMNESRNPTPSPSNVRHRDLGRITDMFDRARASSQN